MGGKPAKVEWGWGEALCEAKLRNGLSVKVSGRGPDVHQCGISEIQESSSSCPQETQVNPLHLAQAGGEEGFAWSERVMFGEGGCLQRAPSPESLMFCPGGQAFKCFHTTHLPWLCSNSPS